MKQRPKKSSTRHPTRLAVFDFDSTLFLSPSLSTSLWHPSLIKAVYAENTVGPGWWRDIRSLELGSPEALKEAGWHGFWNEDIVEQVRRSMKDPLTMTVLLTGRRHNPFYSILCSILSSKGLWFDIIGLRPDPVTASTPISTSLGASHQLIYHQEASVFSSTMTFKYAFLNNVLDNVPSISRVEMWDDRSKHVKQFGIFLHQLQKTGRIKSNTVHYVHGIRPVYNPEWEKATVQKILDSHASVCNAHFQRNTTTLLALMPSRIIIKLSKETKEQIKALFEPIYKVLPKPYCISVADWPREQPEYCGDMVLVNTRLVSKNTTLLGAIGNTVEMTLLAHSRPSWHHGMVLSVKITSPQQPTSSSFNSLLPMWYKPSEHTTIERARYQWINMKQPLHITGQLDFLYLLGIEENTTHESTNNKT
ncbi:hypothetical protein BDF14DRAFT_1766290 [Spinellus fusiger]|nr:hypothetical protein BDF14DRAFT_1766290 [Spinellus fusiger]